VRYEISPGSFALRGRANVDNYTIRRMSIFFGAIDETGAAPTLEEVSNTNVALRLNADWTSMKMIGLMPSAFAGADYLMASGDSGSNSTLVPMVGIGFIAQ
jgi:hypothetical protein